MKTLENLSFQNITLIEHYFDGKLSQLETEKFLRRLTMDNDLRDDFDLVIEMSPQMVTWSLEKKRRVRLAFSTRHYGAAALPVKGNIAKDLVAYGTATIAAAGLLVFISGLFVFLAS
ncbi:hypothetical protein [Flammeovirga pacifica]|uniref:Uncharacterized protein n=1 Tax=Flammeovirga pacifica TaxID=915059 RepID=A0A1S1YZ42_FLAPC|nr:hypothetical protein [Flammeovirga pacifica]OHX66279.1 hypothetical protein NH26_07890 [Flammeovirga pacifica]